MKVLSLFDGMSCGRIALDRLGIRPKLYLASEIDKNAIKVSKANWDDIIHIGDVTKVSYKDGVLTTENSVFEVGQIDLLLGGSPCQSFSFAGNMEGMDGKSGLFYEYVRLLKEIKPRYFLLENVKMKKELENLITKETGVLAVEINSSLLSAQNRRRLYWTNLPVLLPKDLQLVLKDIISTPYLDTNLDSSVAQKEFKRLLENSKYKHTFITLRTKDGRYYPSRPDKLKIQRIGTVSTLDKKVSTLLATGKPCVFDGFTIRQVTRLEMERLQTVPENYTSCVSNSAAHKMLGNGWTVDVICHILKPLTQ
jgi:DNA-cytosine methyltransferase